MIKDNKVVVNLRDYFVGECGIHLRDQFRGDEQQSITSVIYSNGLFTVDLTDFNIRKEQRYTLTLFNGNKVLYTGQIIDTDKTGYIFDPTKIYESGI